MNGSMKIGVETIFITEDARLHDTEDLGEYGSYPTGEIKLSPNLDPLGVGMTLFHESLHAISHQYGLSLTEAKVRVLEQAVASLFRDNPWFNLLYQEHVVHQEPSHDHDPSGRPTEPSGSPELQTTTSST